MEHCADSAPRFVANRGAAVVSMLFGMENYGNISMINGKGGEQSVLPAFPKKEIPTLYSWRIQRRTETVKNQ